jgi:hypothetical protein
MRTTDEVAAMLRLKALGWGERRIAVALGCTGRTVRRYLAAEGWVGYRRPRRAKALDGLMIGWPSGSGGTADVVRQDLLREKGLAVSLRTVERAVAALRQALRAEARATMRLRHRRAISCRPISARPGCRLAASACASTCSWRRWATRGGCLCRRSAMIGSRHGSTASRQRSATLAG